MIRTYGRKVFFAALFILFAVPSLASAQTQTFNADGTFVVPAGVTTISVTASAGGGGGSNAFAIGQPMMGSQSFNGGGGGSGGNISNVSYAVVPGSPLLVSVGGPGAGITNGGTTSISSLFILTGGLSAYYQGSLTAQAGFGGNPNGQAGGGFTCAGATGSMSCPSPIISVGSNGGGNSVGGSSGMGGTTGSCSPGSGTMGAGGGGQAYGCPGSGAAGGSGFVTVTWADPTVGTIDVSSNIAGANWTITGPATLSGSGSSATYTSQPTGTYTITWGAVTGYTTPPSSSFTLTNGGAINFSGSYVVIVAGVCNIGCEGSVQWHALPLNDLDDFTCPSGTRLEVTGGTWSAGSCSGNFLSPTAPANFQCVPDATCVATPQCSDGLDNDGDGLIDFAGGDPGCANATDNDETNAAGCTWQPYSDPPLSNYLEIRNCIGLPIGQDACNAPYAACGFNGGYFGNPACPVGAISGGSSAGYANGYTCYTDSTRTLNPAPSAGEAGMCYATGLVSNCGAPLPPLLSVNVTPVANIPFGTTAFTQNYSLVNGTAANTNCRLLDNVGTPVGGPAGVYASCSGSISHNTPPGPGTFGYYVQAFQSSTGQTANSPMFTVTINAPATAPTVSALPNTVNSGGTTMLTITPTSGSPTTYTVYNSGGGVIAPGGLDVPIGTPWTSPALFAPASYEVVTKESGIESNRSAPVPISINGPPSLTGTQNYSPVATGPTGNSVTTNISTSDTDGPFTYAWTQTGGPAGSTVAPGSNASISNLNYPGTYSWDVRVTDGGGATSAPYPVTVTMTAPAAPVITTAIVTPFGTPTATISSGTTFTLLMNSTGATTGRWSRTTDGVPDWTNQPIPALNGGPTQFNAANVFTWAGQPTARTYVWTFVATNAIGVDSAPRSITLTIEGAVPTASVTPPPGSTTFVPTPVGSVSPSIAFTVSNTGASGSLLSGVASSNDPHFVCAPSCSYANVPVGTPTTINFVFVPTGPPFWSGGAILTFTNTQGASATVNPVIGVSLSPIQFSPMSPLDFGQVVISRPKTLSLRITNISDAAVTFTPTIPAGPFSCLSCISTTLVPGGYADFPITFTPVASTTVSRTMTLPPRLPPQPTETVLITGEGVTPIFKIEER